MTKSDRELQKVTVGYNGLKEDTRGYRGLKGITDNLFAKLDITRYFFLVYLLNKVTRGYRGRQGLTGGYKRLQGVTKGYRGYRVSQRVTRGYRVYKVLQKSSLTRTSPDTFSWPILHNKVTRGYSR